MVRISHSMQEAQGSKWHVFGEEHVVSSNNGTK
jgi:hypothetical protein